MADITPEQTTNSPQNTARAGLASAFTNPAGGGSALNAQAFLAKQIISGKAFAALVVVKAVTPGGVGPVGSVSVQPMVHQVDGYGNVIPHTTIFNLPYFRVQGGANAVIVDPVVGDIGLACFADRDISNVKVTKAVAAPGSWRQNSLSDGLYFGGFLNAIPTSYVAFSNGGINITTPGTFTLTASNVTIDSTGSVHANGDVVAHAAASSVTLSTHMHGTGTAAAGTVSPTPGT
jgi:hypothetical protein